MNRYIALLRGINISGKNKIPMSELKAYLTELGYADVLTYLNSENDEIIAEKIGEPTKESEQISICDNTIFGSFDRKEYAKANWWKKTASTGIGEVITIRTVNTLKKIVVM